MATFANRKAPSAAFKVSCKVLNSELLVIPEQIGLSPEFHFFMFEPDTLFFYSYTVMLSNQR